MKKHLSLIALIAFVIGMTSCGKTDESLLVGLWGLERLEYYTIDYYGEPIASTLKVNEFTPGDMENGIELEFFDNKRGEWRDHDVDTFIVLVSINPNVYETIVNPDTTVVIPFKYSYDEEFNALTIKTSEAETFLMDVESLTETTFIYVNEFKLHSVERAVMKRIDKQSKVKSSGKTSPRVPRPEGSFFSKSSLNK